MTIEKMMVVVSNCSHPDYTFAVQADSRGSIYVQGRYLEKDTMTGVLEPQLTRRWFLNYEMVKSEIVQTVFKLLMTSFEHRAREWFKYHDEPVYGPHFDVDALYEICRAKRFEERAVA